MKISNARRQADAVISKLNLHKPSIDVRDVAQCLGLRLTEMNLGADHSGLLITQPGVTPLIVVHQGHHEHRKRFTIAHEIGHHVLRHHFGDSLIHADSMTNISYRGAKASTGTDPREIAANQFASTLLMPTVMLKRIVDRQRSSLERDLDAVVADLSDRFEVSEQAMTLRLKSMRYL